MHLIQYKYFLNSLLENRVEYKNYTIVIGVCKYRAIKDPRFCDHQYQLPDYHDECMVGKVETEKQTKQKSENNIYLYIKNKDALHVNIKDPLILTLTSSLAFG